MKDTVLTPLGKYLLVGSTSVGAVGAAATTSALMTKYAPKTAEERDYDMQFMQDYIISRDAEVDKREEKHLKVLEDLSAILKNNGTTGEKAIAKISESIKELKGALEKSMEQLHEDLVEMSENNKEDYQNIKEGLFAIVEGLTKDNTIADEISKLGAVVNELKDDGISIKNQLDENRLERLLSGIKEAIAANNTSFELQEIITQLGLLSTSTEDNLEQITHELKEGSNLLAKTIKEGDTEKYTALLKLYFGLDNISKSLENTNWYLAEIGQSNKDIVKGLIEGAKGVDNRLDKLVSELKTQGTETNKSLTTFLEKLKVMPPQDKNLQEINETLKQLSSKINLDKLDGTLNEIKEYIRILRDTITSTQGHGRKP